MDLPYDYEYASDSIYCYPNSNVLKNRFGIMDLEELTAAERELTSVTALSIEENPVPGRFDLNHLRDIHRAIFSEIYPWAGELRDVNISKGTLFCLAQNIEAFADGIFTELKKENYLIGLDYDIVCSRLAYYLGEINMLHPFREGNGRTQRMFIVYLAENVGFGMLNFLQTTQEEMIEACVKAADKDYSMLEEIIRKNLIRIPD